MKSHGMTKTRSATIRVYLKFIVRYSLAFIFLALTLEKLVAHEHSVEDVRRTWEARTSFIQTLRIQFDFSQTEDPPDRRFAPDLIAEGLPRPFTHEVSAKVLLSDNKIAIQFERDPAKIPWMPPRLHFAHNDWGMQSFYSSSRSPSLDSKSGAHVSKSSNPTEFGMFAELFPVFLVYRHRDSGPLSVSLDACRLDEDTATIDGIECVTMVAEGTADSLELSLDPARDFLPLRILQRVNEQPSTMLSCYYAPHSEIGYELTTWKLTLLDRKGQLVRTSDARVVSLQINPRIADEEFYIHYPEGTQVHLSDEGQTVYVKTDGRVPGFNFTESQYGLNRRFLLVTTIAVALTAALIFRLVRRNANSH